MQTFDDCELGETDKTINLELREENRLAVTRIAQQGYSSIEIISRELDPDLFDNSEFIDAVKTMILNNRRAQLRILVFNPKKIVSKGHRLLDLAGTMTSNIEIRVPSYEHKDFNEMVFITDSTAYLHRIYPGRFEATVNFNDKRMSRHYQKQFNEMWEKASQDSNLRRMAI